VVQALKMVQYHLKFLKGLRSKRAKSVVEKKTGKKKKSSQNKCANIAAEKGDESAESKQLIVRHCFTWTHFPFVFNNSFTYIHSHYLTQGVTASSIGFNPMLPTLANDMYEQTSTMTAPVIQGVYTSLLLGVHQDNHVIIC
jgi:hypothetical protein